jgi:predicted transcriptional regulator
MRAKPEYRDRDDTEVAVLDALADRAEEGMTVFELRTRVDVDIDTLEDALAALKDDDLIEAEDGDQRTLIVPEDHAIGQPEPDEGGTIVDAIRRRLPF